MSRVLLPALILWFAAISGAVPSDPAGYFPLGDGASWTYDVETGTTTTAVQPGTVSIGGFSTKEMRDVAGADLGGRSWFSNSDGIRLHREFDPDGAGTIDFTPPILVATNPFDLGSADSVNGTLTTTGIGDGTYSHSWEITARGPMQTPAGFFCDVIKRHEEFSVSVGGQGFSSISDQYFVRDVGLVAQEGVEDEGPFFYTLTSTTLPLPSPDGDCDGLADSLDNCPFYATANPADADGDGRGDECECGDQNGDGRNDVADLVAINLAIFNPALATPLCDANNDGLCNVADIVAVNIEIFSPTSTSVCARQPLPGP